MARYTFLLASPETLRATHRLFDAQANVQNPCIALKRKLQHSFAKGQADNFCGICQLQAHCVVCLQGVKSGEVDKAELAQV